MGSGERGIGRAFVAVADPALTATARAAVTAAGLGTPVNAQLGELVGIIGRHERAVVLFDTSARAWLRIVSDLTAAHCGVLPVLLAEVSHADQFLAAISAGVVGFCSPTADEAAIVRTIESVTSSGVAIPRDLTAPLVEQVRRGRSRAVHTPTGAVDVTEREWEILQLLVQRRSTKEMAAALYVSAGTVRSHVSAVVKKLGAVDRDDAVAIVQRSVP